jgi:hypothetical protein
MSAPAYRLNGKTYMTVNGLSRAIVKDCGCDSHSMVTVTAHGDREIVCYLGRLGAIVARYNVTPPKHGQVMHVTRVLGQGAQS